MNTENSFFIFSKDNFIRRFLFKLSKHKLFDFLVIFFIITSTIKLAIETFYDKSDPDANKTLKNLSLFMGISINIFFTFVIVIKSISMGFILKPKSFCRDKLNVVNLLAVIGFYLGLIWKNETNLQNFFTVK